MLGPVVVLGVLLFAALPPPEPPSNCPPPFSSLRSPSPLAHFLRMLIIAKRTWGFLGTRPSYGGFRTRGPLTTGRILYLCCAAGGLPQPESARSLCAVRGAGAHPSIPKACPALSWPLGVSWSGQRSLVIQQRSRRAIWRNAPCLWY